MIRAVLDTNVVISALLFKRRAGVLVPTWQHRRFALLVSKALLDEYIRVLHYPKFHFTVPEVRDMIDGELLPFITSVRVTRTPRVIHADPSDDHVLACARAGRAEIIVTGDHHLLDLSQHGGIPIVPLASFLERLGA